MSLLIRSFCAISKCLFATHTLRDARSAIPIRGQGTALPEFLSLKLIYLVKVGYTFYENPVCHD